MIRPRRVFREAGPPKTRPIPTPPKHQSTSVQGLNRAVVLVGPMAAGKTSLGKRLARELGLSFVDSDARIQQLHGPITKIFEEQGEDAFREIEAQVIAHELARKEPRIIALGGGAVLRDSTRAILFNHPVILLMSTQDAVLKTANIQRRPLLKNDPTKWQDILDARRPLYEEVASVTFHSNRLGQKQLTDLAASWIQEWARKNEERDD